MTMQEYIVLLVNTRRHLVGVLKSATRLVARLDVLIMKAQEGRKEQ